MSAGASCSTTRARSRRDRAICESILVRLRYTVSFLRQLAVWGPCMKELSLLAREGRNSPATGSASFQPSHVVWFEWCGLNDSNSI